MIPALMKKTLGNALSKKTWDRRLIRKGPHRYLEFGSLDVDRLKQLGIRVDRLGPRLVVCMWNAESRMEIGGYLVVDNLAMGRPSMGGTRMLPDITPDEVHNLSRGMTLKNAAADLPFGGGKSGIVRPARMDADDRRKVIKGFGRLLARYREIYIPGPDVGTNDADMKTFAIENGLNHVVSKPVDMGGNRIDQLGAAAAGVVAATRALLEQLPHLKQLPQFKHLVIPKMGDLDILIQGFGAVGAHVARIFCEAEPSRRPTITGISDKDGCLYSPDGLPWRRLFDLWKKNGPVTRPFFMDLMQDPDNIGNISFSNSCDNLLYESAFCLVPASPVSNYLDVDEATRPSMTVGRTGNWRIIVEGANTYSPDPVKKARRRKMERHVYRDRGVLIATDYLVNSGGVIYAAYERIIPTPARLSPPEEFLGRPEAIEKWLDENREDFARLAEKRRKAAGEKLETVIRRNMEELIEGLCRDSDSLPCEVAERISVSRIASMEKAKTARDVMEPPCTIAVDKSIAEAARILVDNDVPLVSVVTGKGRLIGIVTNWDITRALAGKLPMDTPLTRIMTDDVITGHPDFTILDCIRRLETHEISAMPVVEDDRVTGIISGDILARQTLFRLLQTMV